jgi:RHS repeat-associated protein
MVDSSSAWRGRWADITGLVWLGERYYDPETGRFLSTDPLGHSSDPALYTYAAGDPINFVDPLGLSPTSSQQGMYQTPYAALPRFPDAGGLLGFGGPGDALGLGFRAGREDWGYANLWTGLDIPLPDLSDLRGNRGFEVTHDGGLSGAVNGFRAWLNERWVGFGNAVNRAAGSVQSLWDPVGGAGTASVQDSPTFSSFHRAYRAGSASFQSGHSFAYSAAPYAVDAGLAFGTGGLWAEARALTAARNLARIDLPLVERTLARNVSAAPTPTAPVVDQYALVARQEGFYPVMQRGFREPQAGIWLNAGDVWKYGTTQNPATRYSQTFLREWGLRYAPQSSGTLQEALAAERASILRYFYQHGRLPPGNKIRR